MENFILNKIKVLEKRHKKLEVILNNSEYITNREELYSLSREYGQLSEVIKYFNYWRKTQDEIKEIYTISSNLELHDIVAEELPILKEKIKSIEYKLQELLVPKDINDSSSCYIEIRAGTGGSEAAIFVNDLFRMYNRYAEKRCWQVKILEARNSEHGGCKEIIAKFSGKDVYGRMKFESGGHRVQRIPVTESQGRLHTSTCTVAVIPQYPKTEIPVINTNDLKIDTFRSSGAGGQHVNTTDSAVRVTHLPTGIVVECQDERSQHKNKSRALEILKNRIYAMELSKRQKEESSIRKNLLGSGDRSDRNRTYNFPQKRVTDHRINLTVFRLEDIMNGQLDILIEPIINKYITNYLKSENLKLRI